MPYFRLKCAKICAVVVLLLNASMLLAEEQKADVQETVAGLVEFKSQAGKFSIKLPAQPEHEVIEVGTAKEKQHQFKVGTAQGAYLISYQNNPNLQGNTSKQLLSALESGRDRLQAGFRGKLLESKSFTLNKTHPGLNFKVTIPHANGEARCRFYMVGTRLYQIIAIGTPEFANSKEATQVIDSFKLL
jgi:hypothetical protein